MFIHFITTITITTTVIQIPHHPVLLYLYVVAFYVKTMLPYFITSLNTNTLISSHHIFNNRCVPFSHIITVMATKRNTFIDGINLSEATSLIHLLDTGDVDDGNEAQILKHSAYYGQSEFSKLLINKAGYTILSINI